jgi:hypothetical protein
MKPAIFRWILTIFVMTAAFVAGAATAIYRGWGSDAVRIDVVNNSGVEISVTELEYERCGTKSILQHASLAPGARHAFRFIPCGEAGYRLRAQLADGRELISPGGYAERGYRITEVIEQDRIRSETLLHPW